MHKEPVAPSSEELSEQPPDVIEDDAAIAIEADSPETLDAVEGQATALDDIEQAASDDEGAINHAPTEDEGAISHDNAEEAADTTEPLAMPALAQNSLSTTPLSDVDVAVAVAPQTLDVGTLVGDERYQVVALLGSAPGVNTYRVLDTQGYRRCWACGTGNSLPGDTYCAECGAELGGRHYRLQEFFTSPPSVPDPAPASDEPGDTAPLVPIPAAILSNSIPGVSHVYDTLQSAEEGTVYVIWEEDYGIPLSSWLTKEVDTNPNIAENRNSQPEILGEEQVLTWMAQAAEVLSQLHGNAIVGCPLTLNNLIVQPGDRITLLDPTGCLSSDAGDEEQRQSAQTADIRNLATELERLYVAVRDTSRQGANGREQSPVVATGPLPNAANPAVTLTEAKEGVFPTAEDFAEALRSLYEASRPQTDLLLWSGRASDVGRVRQINEDSVMTLEATALEHEGNLPVGLYVIADGMGGHQSGEVASSIAARTVGAMINSSLLGSMVSGDPVAHDPATCMMLLRQAVLEANRRIADLARERHSDLGTTLVAALVIGNQLTVANVGDSRAYVWHDGNISPITRDHSLVAQLVEAGQITPDEVYTHPRRNEIYRALGDSRIGADEVDVFSHRLQPGDSLLLCSDGLWDFVRDPDIAAIVGKEGMDPQAACKELVDVANRNAGEDNISVVVVRVMGGA